MCGSHIKCSVLLLLTHAISQVLILRMSFVMHSDVLMRKEQVIFTRKGGGYGNLTVISLIVVGFTCRLRELLTTMGDRFTDAEVCR